MQTFYLVSPEVAGAFGDNTKLDVSSHPPDVTHLHYEFQGVLQAHALAQADVVEYPPGE